MVKTAFRTVFTILLLFVSAVSPAQDEMIHRLSDTNYITSLAIAPDHVLAGTLGGLLKLHITGSRAGEYEIIRELDGQTVNDVLIDRHRNIWVGTVNGLYYFNKIRWKRYSHSDGLKHNNVISLFMAENGHLYVGTVRGLDIFYADNFIKNSVTNKIDMVYVSDLSADSLGNVFAANEAGVHYCNNSARLDIYTMFNGLAGENGKALTRDRHGLLWVLTDNGVNQHITRTWWKTYTRYNGFPQEPEGLRGTLAFDSTGKLWVGCDGLSWFDGELWGHYNPENGLPGEKVSAIAIDESDNLWIGTDQGICFFDGNEWKNYQTNDIVHRHWFNQTVEHLAPDLNGNIWIYSDSGMYLYDGLEIQKVYGEPVVEFSNINVMLQDTNGEVWFGTNDGRLGCYDGQFWRNVESPGNMGVQRITDIKIDRQGDTWISGENYIAHRNIQGWNIMSANFASPLVGISFDGKNRIWAATQNKLYHYNFLDGFWQEIIPFDGSPVINITTIAADLDSSVWLGTEESGLVLYDRHKWKSLVPERGFASRKITTLAYDLDEQLWIGTLDAGLVKYWGVTGFRFSLIEGIEVADVRSIIVDNDNNKWFGTSQGVYILGGELERDVTRQGYMGEFDSELYSPPFSFMQNYPNPFNNETKIRLDTDVSVYARVSIYSITGRFVKELDSGMLTPGTHYFTWDGTNSSGQKVSSGMYICQLQAGIHTQSSRLTLIR